MEDNMKKRMLTTFVAILAIALTLALAAPAALAADAEPCTSTADCAGGYINGFCSECGGYETPSGEGTEASPWLVSNAGELYWVAQRVHGSAVNAATSYVRLTADITVNESVLLSDGSLNGTGENFRAWTPVKANVDLDGDMHTISGLYADLDSDVGMFATSANHNVSIRDLGIVDSYFKGTDCVGSFVGLGWNGVFHINNCFSTATVVTTGNNSIWTCVGGLVGRIQGTKNVSNSFFAGKAIGATAYVGAISGYPMSPQNCYYLAGSAVNAAGQASAGIGSDAGAVRVDIAGQTDAVSADDLVSGKAAFLLQGEQTEHVWGQTIGTDPMPVFAGAKVYAHYTECVLSGYSNEEFTGEVVHDYDANGVCAKCEGLEPAQLVTADNAEALGLTEDYVGYYAIANYGQLYHFVAESNATVGGLNGVLIDNITVNEKVLENGVLIEDPSGLIPWTPLKSYNGVFDGNGYAIRGLYAVTTASSEYLGFVSNGTGTVKDLLVKDTYFRAADTSGGIFAYMYNGARVLGCGFDGYIMTDANEVGGIVGYFYSASNEIRDCYHIGTVISSDLNAYVGGILGSGSSGLVKNCYSLGSVSGGKYVGGIAGSYVGEGSVVNSYYVTGSASLGIGNHEEVDAMTKAIPAEDIASGKLAYVLNMTSDTYAWGQDLAFGAYPVPNAPAVYAVYGETCVITSYSNDTAYADMNPDHSKENGICTVCGDIDRPVKITAENLSDFEGLDESYIGYYAIGNYGQLIRYRDDLIHALEPTAKGVLVSDITVNRGVLTEDGVLTSDVSDLVLWTPIGNTSHIYKGVFDGNGHTVSGIYIVSDAEHVGLFGYTSGATIKDLTLTDSYIKGSNYTGGIVGYHYLGYMTDVSVNAVVVGGNYVGGIAGYTQMAANGSGLAMHGSVSGGGYVGGLFGRVYLGGTQTYNLTDSVNYAKVLGTGDQVGGIVGMLTGVLAKNLANHGEVTGARYVGGIVGENLIVIESSFNTGDVSGTGYVGGIVGKNSEDIYFCYNTGDISGGESGSYVGGIAGYIPNTAFKLENCYSIGAVTGGSNVGAISPNNVSGINYYLAGAGSEDDELALTAEEFASGKVTWLLNGGGRDAVTDGTQRWCQTLGTDMSPRHTGETVYFGYENENCDGSERTYANRPLWFDQIHPYENGICECGHMEMPLRITAENCSAYGLDASYIGYYAIENAGNLYWFSRLTSDDLGYDFLAGDNTASAVLVGNITVNDAVLETDGTLVDNTAELLVWEMAATSSSARFGGVFDGNGHTLRGLYACYTDAALFKYIDTNGVVKDLTIRDSAFRSATVVTYNMGTVENCHSFATVIYIADDHTSYDMGGICSGNRGLITRSSFEGRFITDPTGAVGNIGGIVNDNSGTVSYCYNTADIIVDIEKTSLNSAFDVGGIVSMQHEGMILSCYNTGDLQGFAGVGGICGSMAMAPTDSVVIVNCYNIGSVEGYYAVGAISGDGSAGDTRISGCYYLENCAVDKNGVESLADSAVGTGRVAVGGIGSQRYYEMHTDAEGVTDAITGDSVKNGELGYLLNGSASTGDLVWGQTIGADLYPVHGGMTIYEIYYCDDSFCGYANSDDVAHKYDEYGFCTVLIQNEHCSDPYQHAPVTSGKYDIDEDGELDDLVYEISTGGHLVWFASYVDAGNPDANAILIADVIMNENVLNEDGTPVVTAYNELKQSYHIWTGIGATNTGYNGIFDGNGHTISGSVTFSQSGYGGIFGRTGSAFTVKNLGLVDSLVYHDSTTISGMATLVNMLYGGTVRNCYSTATMLLTAECSGVGGLVSGSNGGRIEDSYFAGKLLRLFNSGSHATLQGTICGGIIGSAANGTVISGCYNEADFDAFAGVGGIAGELYASYVINCYNFGNISGGFRVGGIAGRITSDVIGYDTPTPTYVINSYSAGNAGPLTTEDNIPNSNIGGLIGDESGGIVINCYYLPTEGAASGIGEMPDALGVAMPLTEDMLTTGELAYLLSLGHGSFEALGGKTVSYDGILWGQDLDNGKTVQTYPNLVGAAVWVSGYCDGSYESDFTNDKTKTTFGHKAMNPYGYCGGCQVKITGARVAIGTDLTLTYAVDVIEDALAQAHDELAMRFTVNGKVTVVPLDVLKTDDDGDYLFPLDLTPQCMTDTVKAELLFGDTVIASKDAYSIREYADTLLDAYAGLTDYESLALTTLVKNMLRYGSAAQIYRDYRTDALADAGIGDGFSADVPPTTDKLLTTADGVTLGDVYFTGVTVRFSNINRIVVHVNSTEGATLTVNGEPVAFDGTTAYTEAIYATEFDKIFEFQLYDGETLVQTLRYSVSSYVYSMQSSENASMKSLATALYNYGVSARAYADRDLVMTKDELLAAVADGKIVALGADIDLGVASIDLEDQMLTINLNGYRITGSGYYVIRLREGGILTLKGSGSVTGGETATVGRLELGDSDPDQPRLIYDSEITTVGTVAVADRSDLTADNDPFGGFGDLFG